MNLQIHQSFNLYIELVKERKTITQNPIILQEKQSNRNWLSKTVDAQHSSLEEDVLFTTECRKDNYLYYGVKLKYSALSDKPYFRFDSDGPAHRNKCPDIKLEDQIITTPHFNSFDKHGCEIAYKSEKLKNEVEALEIVKDINFGVAHFCMESNTRLNEDSFPSVLLPILPSLGFEIDSPDPLSSIKFE